jgi:hypothetical protein
MALYGCMLFIQSYLNKGTIMAYIKTDEVKAIRNQLKATFPNLKFSVRRQHYSSVDVTIKAGNIDFTPLFKNGWDRGYIQLNPYHLHNYGEFQSMFEKMVEVIKTAPILVGGDPWYDKSDAMVDYFDTAYYFHLNIGEWDKPYELKGSA